MKKINANSKIRIQYIVYFMFFLVLLSGCDGEINEKKLEESKESLINILENDKEIAPFITSVKWEYLDHEFTYKNNIEFLEHGYYYYRLTTNTDNVPYNKNAEMSSQYHGSLYEEIHTVLRTSKFLESTYSEELDELAIQCGWATTCYVEVNIENNTPSDFFN